MNMEEFLRDNTRQYDLFMETETNAKTQLDVRIYIFLIIHKLIFLKKFKIFYFFKKNSVGIQQNQQGIEGFRGAFHKCECRKG